MSAPQYLSLIHIWNPRITCELWDKDNLLGECAVEDGKASCPVEAPVLCNAEEPYQYILKIKTPEEILIQRVGIDVYKRQAR